MLNRANQSLLNPQFATEKWSDEEERTLVMGMKVYGTENAASDRRQCEMSSYHLIMSRSG